MRAPTLWEEGRWSGGRVTRLAALACAALLTADLVVGRGLGPLFAVGFVLVCAAAALAVHPRDFFSVGVLPPPLLLGTAVLAALVDRGQVAPAGDGFWPAVIAVLADCSGALLTGYLVVAAVLAVRHRVLQRARTRRPPHRPALG
ncbi:MAG: DUF6542 domain-containing protein [Marmoricola sp.]